MKKWGRHKYGEAFDVWPLDENGEYEKAAMLTTVIDHHLDAELTVGLLQSCGIPSVVNYPAYGTFGKIMLGFSGEGAEIYVPASRLDEARQIIESEPTEVDENDIES